MEATADHVLILPDEAETKTKAGLYLNQQWKDLPPKGTIVAVGPEVTDKRIKKDARVIFYRYAAQMLTDVEDLKDIRVVREDNVIALIKD